MKILIIYPNMNLQESIRSILKEETNQGKYTSALEDLTEEFKNEDCVCDIKIEYKPDEEIYLINVILGNLDMDDKFNGVNWRERDYRGKLKMKISKEVFEVLPITFFVEFKQTPRCKDYKNLQESENKKSSLLSNIEENGLYDIIVNTGLHVNEVEQKVDTGAIISELNFKIEKNMDVNDAHKIITMALKEWVPQEVVKWLNNEKKPISMEPYTLFKIYPEKKDNNFFNSKWRLNDSINLVRAVNPPYGPGAIYQGDRRTVRVAVPFSKTSSKHIEKNSIGKINLKLDDGFMACYMLPISK